MPFAPGTFGSLVGVLLFWFMKSLGARAYAAVVAGMAVVGIFICGQTARDLGAIDPGRIVYDEVVGFLVAMYLLPAKVAWIIPGFIIYRVFDIWKPWPIHAAEQHLGLGGGIMADDIVAGLYTLAILHAVRFALGSRLSA
jgi:phosphatidylglycerophosphatase A